MREQIKAVVCAAVVTCSGLGCSSAAPKVIAEASLGPAGGQLAVGSSARLQVAPGALHAEVKVSGRVVEPPLPPPGARRSDVLELTPHGTRFDVPARLTLRYDAAAVRGPLQVLRLADAADATWEPVGGVHFGDGSATFDLTHFSYYVVSEGVQCELVAVAQACDASCECCGTATCVDRSTDVAHCGGCGVACPADAFCDSTARCRRVGIDALCANQQLYVVQGELPALDVVSPEQTIDGVYAAQLASAIATACPGMAVQTVSQAADGLLDPCTDAPLVGGGTTLLVTGGGFAQRVARYLESDGSGVLMEVSADELQYTFRSRSGAVLISFPRATLSDDHDYFVIGFERDPAHGAQVLQVYGVGWEGTPAATWYFVNRVLPARAADTLTWSRYALVEWRDDGDGEAGEGDAFTVLAADAP